MVDFLFNTLTLPASVGAALRSVSCGVASSVKSIWRAQTSHTLRWPVSETVIDVLSFPATDAVASETSGWRFSSARSGLPASAFGKCAKVSLSPASFAPNKSFKPTPHRGVNSVLCATLHAVATPPWGGLTPALGGRKAICSFADRNCDSSASAGIALRTGSRHVCSWSSLSGALTHRMRCAYRLRWR